jgi:hypothetical protein
MYMHVVCTFDVGSGQRGRSRRFLGTSDESDDEADAPQASTLPQTTPVKLKEGEVSLVVGGRRFIIEIAVLQKHPDTMLGRMFGSSFETQLSKASGSGDYVLSHSTSPATFKAILDFYKHGYMRCPPNVAVAELRDACEYLLIPFNHQSVRCEDMGKFLHELSNNGAKVQFERFLDEVVVSAMARCAQVCGLLFVVMVVVVMAMVIMMIMMIIMVVVVVTMMVMAMMMVMMMVMMMMMMMMMMFEIIKELIIKMIILFFLFFFLLFLFFFFFFFFFFFSLSSTQLGERECHIVVLSDNETVEWDDDLPPQLGEQYAQSKPPIPPFLHSSGTVIHSSALSRFLKYPENRDIAKTVLKERGLKKIKISSEGTIIDLVSSLYLCLCSIFRIVSHSVFVPVASLHFAWLPQILVRSCSY